VGKGAHLSCISTSHGDGHGHGERQPSTESTHRAQGTEHRAQSTEHRKADEWRGGHTSSGVKDYVRCNQQSGDDVCSEGRGLLLHSFPHAQQHALGQPARCARVRSVGGVPAGGVLECPVGALPYATGSPLAAAQQERSARRARVTRGPWRGSCAWGVVDCGCTAPRGSRPGVPGGAEVVCPGAELVYQENRSGIPGEVPGACHRPGVRPSELAAGGGRTLRGAGSAVGPGLLGWGQGPGVWWQGAAEQLVRVFFFERALCRGSCLGSPILFYPLLLLSSDFRATSVFLSPPPQHPVGTRPHPRRLLHWPCSALRPSM